MHSQEKTKLIDAKLAGDVLVLSFDDASSRNSFSVRAAQELVRVLEHHQSSGQPTFKALVFTARGRVFCSGGNLSDYASMTTPEQGKEVNRRITQALDTLDRLSVPTICAVSGDCFGGGVELISAFDEVISAPHAAFGLWQRRIGLTFGWGGGARLEERLGKSVLRRLALSAENFVAAEALHLGLIDSIVPESKILEQAMARANALKRLPSAPVGALKTWTSEREQEIFESLWWNEEHQAVLKKFRRNSEGG